MLPDPPRVLWALPTAPPSPLQNCFLRPCKVSLILQIIIHYYQRTTRYTTEDVLEMVTADDDNVVEHFDLGSDDELEFNNYYE